MEDGVTASSKLQDVVDEKPVCLAIQINWNIFQPLYIIILPIQESSGAEEMVTASSMTHHKEMVYICSFHICHAKQKLVAKIMP